MPEHNLSLQTINSLLAKRQIKYSVFLVVLALMMLAGIVSYANSQKKFILLGLSVIVLFLITTFNNLIKLVKLRKKLKENPEQYKNAQGQFSLSDMDLLLGSWFLF